MNRRGFLLGEEAVKMILAIISISFLIFLLFSLYNAHSKDRELNQATSSLERLISEIDAGVDSVEILNPQGWYISSFPQDDLRGNRIIPLSCSGLGWRGCLCFYSAESGDDLSSFVDQSGVCRESDYSIEEDLFITSGGFMFRSGYSIKGIEITKFSGLSGVIGREPLNLGINHENKIIEALN